MAKSFSLPPPIFPHSQWVLGLQLGRRIVVKVTGEVIPSNSTLVPTGMGKVPEGPGAPEGWKGLAPSQGGAECSPGWSNHPNISCHKEPAEQTRGCPGLKGKSYSGMRQDEAREAVLGMRLCAGSRTWDGSSEPPPRSSDTTAA